MYDRSIGVSSCLSWAISSLNSISTSGAGTRLNKVFPSKNLTFADESWLKATISTVYVALNHQS